VVIGAAAGRYLLFPGGSRFNWIRRLIEARNLVNSFIRHLDPGHVTARHCTCKSLETTAAKYGFTTVAPSETLKEDVLLIFLLLGNLARAASVSVKANRRLAWG
jgi:hypothetical protein